MLTTILFIVSSFYSIFVFLNVAGKVWKEKRFTGVRSELFFSNTRTSILDRCVPIFLTLCLIMPFADFYDVISKKIPEDSYIVESTLSIDNYENQFVFPLSIYYIEDIEYETDYDKDPLIYGGYSKDVEITRSFRLTEDQEITLDIDGFTPEYLASLPDSVSSGESFRASIVGKTHEDGELLHAELRCTITMPQFTHAALGLTTQDILESISLLTYVEYIIIFIASLFNFCIYVWGKDEPSLKSLPKDKE